MHASGQQQRGPLCWQGVPAPCGPGTCPRCTPTGKQRDRLSRQRDCARLTHPPSLLPTPPPAAVQAVRGPRVHLVQLHAGGAGQGGWAQAGEEGGCCSGRADTGGRSAAACLTCAPWSVPANECFAGRSPASAGDCGAPLQQPHGLVSVGAWGHVACKLWRRKARAACGQGASWHRRWCVPSLPSS